MLTSRQVLAAMQVASETSASYVPPCPRSQLGVLHAWPTEQHSTRRHRRLAARRHASRVQRMRGRTSALADDSGRYEDLW